MLLKKKDECTHRLQRICPDSRIQTNRTGQEPDDTDFGTNCGIEAWAMLWPGMELSWTRSNGSRMVKVSVQKLPSAFWLWFLTLSS
jgi:hypothetical protein